MNTNADGYLFEKFLSVQVRYLNDAKYYEGINRGIDPGEFFIVNVISEKAKEIRYKWESSKCKYCNNSECLTLLLSACEKYKPDEKLFERLIS